MEDFMETLCFRTSLVGTVYFQIFDFSDLGPALVLILILCDIVMLL
jgi:hypothetical protein